MAFVKGNIPWNKRTGDLGFITCKSCGVYTDKFYSKSGLLCKICYKIQVDTNRIKKVFGISYEQYNQMMQEAQICALCHQDFDDTNDTTYYHDKVLDHCHITGTIRGVLHSKCNSALGFFNDSAEICYNAYLYLQGFKK